MNFKKIMKSKKFQKRKYNSISKNSNETAQKELKIILKSFDLLREKVNTINKTKFSSVDLASYIVDSQKVTQLTTPAHYPPICHFYDGIICATVSNGKKRLKVILIKELFELDYPSKNVKLGGKFIPSFKITDFVRLHTRLKEIARLYIQTEKKLIDPNQSNKTEVNSVETKEINWEIFPKGNWLDSKEISAKLIDHFRNLQNKREWRDKTFDKNRIDKIYHKLKPITCKIGKKKFEGYIVYFFDWTDKVILECPIYGNATYVINPGKHSWQEIAKNSKWEARTDYSEQIIIIYHNETWIDRLEQNLRYGF